MKTHYDQLGVGHAAPPEDIRRAFRREIARYHPDKVQHLGPEFMAIATVRAAELTEAYRVLIDPEARREYDGTLGRGVPRARRGVRASEAPVSDLPPEPHGRRSREAHEPLPPAGERFERGTAAAEAVRRAVVARLRDAVAAVAGSAAPLGLAGFDAAYRVSPRRSLLGRSPAALLLVARITPRVDAAAVEGAWPALAKSGTFDAAICLMLLGTGIAPASELGAAIERGLRRSRKTRPIVVPVDVRSWEALFPAEAPEIVRRIVERLRSGG